MQESRQLRRARLAEAIARQRRSLYASSLTVDLAPSSIKDRIAAQIRKMTDELQSMEEEFHALNVEQIREELKRRQ